jgi:sugar/nucleoside kinase (ribokinase family)
MMSMVDLVVVGSVAYDSITTPFGSRERVLGGSASYFSMVASFFCRVGLVGIIGRDLPASLLDPHAARGVDLAGLKVDHKRDSFFWEGLYEGDMNTARTVDVHLNVLGDFSPVLPEEYRSAPFLFLANSHPKTQMSALTQMSSRPFACSDSMDLWINNQRTELVQLLSMVDGFFCNDGEARMLGGEKNLIRSGRSLLDLCRQFVVVKKGEHGALLFHRDGLVGAPAFPCEGVVDPTGAGDSFAGGFMGSLARNGRTDRAALREAVLDGTVMASFTVEGFGLERLLVLTEAEIAERKALMADFMAGGVR